MEFLSTNAGKLKIVTLVFSIIPLGIMADIYKFTSLDSSFVVPKGMSRMTKIEFLLKVESVFLYNWKEHINLAALSIALVASVALIAASSLNLGKKMAQWRVVDMAIQILMGVVLPIGWIFYLLEVKDLDDVVKFLSEETGEEKPSIYNTWLIKAICVLAFEAVEILLFYLSAFLTSIEK